MDVCLKPLTPLFWSFLPESLDSLTSSTDFFLFGFLAALHFWPSLKETQAPNKRLLSPALAQQRLMFVNRLMPHSSAVNTGLSLAEVEAASLYDTLAFASSKPQSHFIRHSLAFDAEVCDSPLCDQNTPSHAPSRCLSQVYMYAPLFAPSFLTVV
ncbi:hypothetical protein B0H19DRAFT_1383024 [Mycena capillaripes]|nr:hypothetical protein B0H19DRAFT_1383024 [Mycena capillaripes]